MYPPLTHDELYYIKIIQTHNTDMTKGLQVMACRRQDAYLFGVPARRVSLKTFGFLSLFDYSINRAGLIQLAAGTCYKTEFFFVFLM